MKKDITAHRKRDRHGNKSFKKAAGAMSLAGFTVPANRFKEALSQRKRLMEQLRRLDPENALLIELEELDRKPV
tara:strand:- start:1650 stop:1871 length:222 start_codon:yes stop_codon:yes gene_type:complete